MKQLLEPGRKKNPKQQADHHTRCNFPPFQHFKFNEWLSSFPLQNNFVFIIKNIKNWNLEEIEISIKAYVTESNIKLFELAQPLRIILTGSNVSIGIYDIILSLGKNLVIDRVNNYLKN